MTIKRQPGWQHVLRIGLGLAGLVFLAAGCSKARLTDERNPFYIRGKNLLEREDYQEAAAAFHQCLRLSPSSALAHLQLGMLYEDVFTDPLKAVYHYREFLEQRPDAEEAAAVQRWIERVERTYLLDLLNRHPDAAPRAAPPPALAEPAGLTDRERQLARRVRELNSEVVALRRQLRVAAPEPAPGPAVEAPVPSPEAPLEAAPAPTPADRVYTVVKGDTLSRLAREFYGDLKYWPLLHKYNRDTVGEKPELFPGMELRVPTLQKLRRASAEN